MELEVTREFTKNVDNSKTNIGWNNFDADVSNGYKFKPKSDWEGLYVFLYFINGDKIISTTDKTLTDAHIINEDFEKFFVKKRGTVDRIEMSDDFKILRYKTWSCGKTSEWKSYL